MAKIKGSFEKVLDVSTPVKLIVITKRGDVRLERRTQDERISSVIRFTMQAFNREEARQTAEKIKADPPIEVQGNLIKIGDLSKYREHFSWLSSVALDFDIQAKSIRA